MRNKIASALLSVAIAFGLWLYVITSVSPGSVDTYDNIPVVWEGESVLNDRGLMLTYKSADSVTLKLSGNRSDLSKVNRGNITIRADLSKIYEPGNLIALQYSTLFPGDVPSNAFVVESKTPGTLVVSTAWRITREVPVEVKWLGSAPEGFMSDRENRVLDYPTVTVTGPDSVVNTIEKAVIEVDLNEQRESISEDYAYTLCDAEGKPVDAQLITTNVEQIHLEVKIRRVKEVRLEYTVVDGGGATAANADFAMTPETIRVSGSETALDQLGDTITVGTIHMAEISQSTAVPFEIILPEGITNLTGVTQATVEVRLKGLSTRDLTVENINIVNLPEDMEADLITEKMTVTVRGPSGLISSLTPEQVFVTVDFAEAEVGTSTFKATISFAEGFESLGAMKADPVSASVRLKED